MTLLQYFEAKSGVGVLSTADENGVLNSAVYARPHVMEDGTLAFIMAAKGSYANLSANPHAAYLFIEEGKGYSGKRLKLTKVKEERDTPLIQELRRRTYSMDNEERIKPLSLVYFRVDLESPLVGSF